MDKAIYEARESLGLHNAKDALKVLKPFKKVVNSTENKNLDLIQVFADAYLEDGQVEKAYSLLVKASL